MKRFLSKTFLFLLPVALLAVAFEYLQRQSPHEFRYKARYMEKYADRIETLFLGPSYLHGIDISGIPNSFNLSYDGQALEFSMALWEKYRDSMPRLKNVVTTLSYFFHINNRSGVEAWRTPFYNIYYDLPQEDWSLKAHFFAANPKIAEKHLLTMVGSLYGKDTQEIRYDSLGCAKFDKASRPDNWEHINPHLPAMHSDFSEEQSAKNIALLEKMIRDARQRGIRVLVVTPPTWHTYHERLSDRVVRHSESVGQRLDSLYDNVVYLNFLGDKRFVGDDYNNSSHLNYDYGGRKLAVILSGYLQSATDSLPTRPPHSEDASNA